MTAPVTVAAPAGRATPGPSAGGGSADSAAPFASALDGALAGGHGPARDATCGGGQRSPGDAATGSDGEGTEETAAAPVVDAAAATVAATLWALTLAGGTAAAQAAGAVDAAASGTPGTGTPGLPAAGAAALGAVALGTVAAGEAATPAAVPAAAAAGVPASVGGVPAAGPLVPGAAAGTGPGSDPAGTATPGAGPAGATPTGQATQTAPELTVVTGAAPGASTDALSAPTGTTATSEPTGAGAPAPLAGAVPTPGQDAGAGDGRSDQQPAVVTTAPVDGTDTADAESGITPLAGATTPAAGAVTATAPVGETDAATGTAATQPVSGQVSRQVALLSSAGNGSHTMTLVLTPENLGPVEVQVTVHQGNLDLHLRGAHDMGRAALLDALPELRRDLEAAGLSPSRVEVDADTGGSWLAKHAAEQQAQQHSGDRGTQPNQAGERSRSGGRPADSGEGPTRPSNRSTSSGVDVRV